MLRVGFFSVVMVPDFEDIFGAEATPVMPCSTKRIIGDVPTPFQRSQTRPRSGWTHRGSYPGCVASPPRADFPDLLVRHMATGEIGRIAWPDAGNEGGNLERCIFAGGHLGGKLGLDQPLSSETRQAEPCVVEEPIRAQDGGGLAEIVSAFLSGQGILLVHSAALAWPGQLGQPQQDLESFPAIIDSRGTGSRTKAGISGAYDVHSGSLCLWRGRVSSLPQLGDANPGLEDAGGNPVHRVLGLPALGVAGLYRARVPALSLRM